MHIIPVRTKAITPQTPEKLLSILDQYLPVLLEGSIVVVTSKIVSICERSYRKVSEVANEEDLVKKEADFYLPSEISKYAITITIKNNLLIPTAGIDESNGNGYYILWPKDPQKTANEIRQYLSEKYHLHDIGVVITDSKTTPLRWGTTGVAIGYSGFKPLQNYIGKPDIFGRNLMVTKANILDGLAAAAVLVMGEGDEQTPLAVISDVSFVSFVNTNPSKKELESLKISIDDDLYAPLLKSVPWEKGGNARSKQLI